MKKILLIALACCTTWVYGQDAQRQKQLKIYSNFQQTTTHETIGFDTSSMLTSTQRVRDTRIGYFTPAFGIQTRSGNYHEIELSRIAINQSHVETRFSENADGALVQQVVGNLRTNVALGLRYEYNLLLLKKKEDLKLKPYLGVAVMPYFSNASFAPSVSYMFPRNETAIGGSTQVVPRLTYSFSERWVVDLNVLITITDFQWKVTGVQNPTVAENQSTYTTEFESFPNSIQIRLGLGIRL